MGDAAATTGAYVLHHEIGAGGMAKVHLGRLVGPGGFARTVAIKRLHPHLAADPVFAAMFLEEARLAAHIRHANVVPTLDVVAAGGEAFLVLEYVHGEALSALVREVRARGERIPVPIACAILENVLAGLHAAHEVKGSSGELAGIVHRDVSPHNVLVGVDGIARVLDFGVAKAKRRHDESTGDTSLKGKLAYMAPEQVGLKRVDRRADVFCASIVLWELVTGHRLFATDEPAATIQKLIHERIAPPNEIRSDVSPALSAVVMRGLERDPDKRWRTALEMRAALEEAERAASTRAVGEWVEATAREALEARAAKIAEVERSGDRSPSRALTRLERAAPLGVASTAASEAATEISIALAGEPASPPPRAADPSITPDTDAQTASKALSLGAPAERASPSRVGTFAVASIAVIGIGAIVFGVRRVSTAGATTSVTTSEVMASRAAEPPAPSTTAAIAPLPPSSAEATPPPAPSSAPATLPSSPSIVKVKPLPRSPPPAKSDHCTPNFTIDDRGIKHLKAECL